MAFAQYVWIHLPDCPATLGTATAIPRALARNGWNLPMPARSEESRFQVPLDRHRPARVAPEPNPETRDLACSLGLRASTSSRLLGKQTDAKAAFDRP